MYCLHFSIQAASNQCHDFCFHAGEDHGVKPSRLRRLERCSPREGASLLTSANSCQVRLESILRDTKPRAPGVFFFCRIQIGVLGTVLVVKGKPKGTTVLGLPLRKHTNAPLSKWLARLRLGQAVLVNGRCTDSHSPLRSGICQKDSVLRTLIEGSLAHRKDERMDACAKKTCASVWRGNRSRKEK